jgi:hypothetical protein
MMTVWLVVSFRLDLHTNSGLTRCEPNYRSVLEKNRLVHVAKTAVQLLRRVPPNIPSSVSATVITKDESAVTGGQSQVMLIGTPDGRIADLRKQKEAVMLLSSTHDEDDMSYYAILFKRTMESDISAAT